MRRSGIRRWLLALRPGPAPAGLRDVLRIAVGAALGITVSAWLMRWLSVPLELRAWFVAPMGASAVLVFALPASPLAQPWAVIMGNVLSAVVGVFCTLAVSDVALASGLAVGLAVAGMCLCRCLHPPGGAVALLVVLTQVTQWHFAVLPVGLDALLLVCAGMLWHPLGGRSYPHQDSRLST